MRSVSAPTIALMSEGKIRYHVAYLMELPDSPNDGAIWSGSGDLTFDGITYRGLVASAMATPLTFTVGIGAEGATMGITSLDAALFSKVLTANIRNRWVTIYDLYFNVQDSSLLHYEPVFSGTIDTVSTRDVPGDLAALEINASGEGQGAERGLGRLAADQDQKKIDPLDTAFRLVSTIAQRVLVWFGKEPRRSAVSITS